MTHPHSLAGTRVRKRRLVLVSALAVLIMASSAIAQDELSCGERLAGRIEGGAEDLYSAAVAASAVCIVDVTELSGLAGAVGVSAVDAPDMCRAEASVPGGTVLQVAACEDGEGRDYAIALNIVSDDPDSCGTELQEGVGIGRQLQLGQVDSYTFFGRAGDGASVVPFDSGPTAGVLVRVFSPSGQMVAGGNACGGVHVELPVTGTYTVLASACGGVGSLSYSLIYKARRIQEPLLCGDTLTRTLEEGGVDVYTTVKTEGSVVAIDAVDVSGTLGVLRMRAINFLPPIDSCGGNLQFSHSSRIEVSDCVGNDGGEYAVSMTIVSESPDSCAVPLPCGTLFQDGAGLGVPGEVDSYSFRGVEGERVTVEAAGTGDAVDSIRLRLFDPVGELVDGVDSCSGSLAVDLPSSGLYTLLVSACDGLQTGAYEVRWEPAAGCPGIEPSDELAYVTNGESGSVAIIDLGRNTLAGLIPLHPRPASFESTAQVASNNGTAFVTFYETGQVTVINTTTNRVVGPIILPFEPVLRFALHPSGAFLYAGSEQLQGIGVVDTASRKLVSVIPLDGAGPGPIAVSPDGAFLYAETSDPDPPCEFQPCAGEIRVVDLSTGETSAVIADERIGSLQDIVFAPSGQLAYLLTRPVLAIDTATHSIMATVEGTEQDFHGIAFSPDGKHAYLAGEALPGKPASGVLVVDTSTHTVADRIPTTGIELAFGIAVSTDGARLYVTDFEAESSSRDPAQPGVEVIDLATRRTVALIPTFGTRPSAIAIARPPDGLCTADERGETKVTVGELVKSVNFALATCPTDPGRFGPTQP